MLEVTETWLPFMEENASVFTNLATLPYKHRPVGFEPTDTYTMD